MPPFATRALIGAASGAVAAAAAQAWCRWRQARLEKADLAVIEAGQADDEWVGLLEAQAKASASVSPTVISRLVEEGLATPELAVCAADPEYSRRHAMRLRCGAPWALAWAPGLTASAALVAGVTGNALAAAAASCLGAVAVGDWTLRTISPGLCAAMTALSVAAWPSRHAVGAALVVALAALALTAGFKRAACGRSDGAFGGGDVVLVAAIASSLSAHPAGVVPFLLAAVAELACMLAWMRSRGTQHVPVPLAPVCWAPFLLAVCAA